LQFKTERETTKTKVAAEYNKNVDGIGFVKNFHGHFCRSNDFNVGELSGV
jgi:hypothetical protein